MVLHGLIALPCSRAPAALSEQLLLPLMPHSTHRTAALRSSMTASTAAAAAIARDTHTHTHTSNSCTNQPHWSLPDTQRTPIGTAMHSSHNPSKRSQPSSPLPAAAAAAAPVLLMRRAAILLRSICLADSSSAFNRRLSSPSAAFICPQQQQQQQQGEEISAGEPTVEMLPLSILPPQPSFRAQQHVWKTGVLACHEARCNSAPSSHV